ncbi:MAG TPA: nitroreductase/quinone reductase family protein [Candidatus Dormibacteraeota bacterium]|nr:nitroreductase/quinone reductase family protein [Candidatus Dormibacteraeota bacterium]
MLRAGGAIHRFMYRRGLARRMGKLQVLLLTTTGRKTGRPQTVPVNGVPEGDGFFVIGSAGGSDFDPAWWLNLVANPKASIQVNDRLINVRMEPVTDPAERRRLWDKAVASMPRYAGYEKKTKRVIPLGLLRPV